MMKTNDTVLVAGAGGFIGGHLVADLRRRGFTRIRAVDVKPLHEWFQVFDDVDNRRLDLRLREACMEAAQSIHFVFNHACDMGGMGFIELNKARCMLSVLINTHLLEAALEAGARRYFYASSACVYPADRQVSPNVVALAEPDAYPAMPEDGYGWEKLFSERMCRHFDEDFGLEVRIARYHNVYGPHGTFAGGREKAPAAVCRKVAEAKLGRQREIEIWGDGDQTRSFTFIADALQGTRLLMESDAFEPLNIGSSELVSINQLVDIVEEIAGIKLHRRYDLSAPQGVRGRNSDNARIRERLGWEPATSLATGLEATYRWIHDQVAHEMLIPGSTNARSTERAA
jgi:nucleoside-diphosphate-sugar epimerase